MQYREGEMRKEKLSVLNVKQFYKSELQLKGHQKPQRNQGCPFPPQKRMGLHSLSRSPDTGTSFHTCQSPGTGPGSVQRKREGWHKAVGKGGQTTPALPKYVYILVSRTWDHATLPRAIVTGSGVT